MTRCFPGTVSGSQAQRSSPAAVPAVPVKAEPTGSLQLGPWVTAGCGPPAPLPAGLRASPEAWSPPCGHPRGRRPCVPLRGCRPPCDAPGTWSEGGREGGRLDGRTQGRRNRPLSLPPGTFLCSGPCRSQASQKALERYGESERSSHTVSVVLGESAGRCTFLG